MPDRTVEPRKHNAEQARIIRKLRAVTARIAKHSDDYATRDALYADGRRAGLVHREMADIAGTSEVAVIKAVQKEVARSGIPADPPERVRRKSVEKVQAAPVD